MEFLCGLNKEETRRKMARQRRLRHWFWIIGTALLAIQAIAAIRWSGTESSIPVLAQATSPAATLSLTLTKLHTPALTTTLVRTSTTAIPLSPTLSSHTPTCTPTAPGTGYGMPETNPAPGEALDPSDPMKQSAKPISSTVLLSASAPMALASPPDLVSEQSFRLVGTGQPGQSISVLYTGSGEGNSLIAQATADEQGQWQVEVPTAPLVRGQCTFSIQSANSHPISFTTTFAPWWLDAPMRLQASLGEGYACAPTALGMAMDYYHQLDSRYPAPATVDLVKALTRKGFISGYGADAQMLCDLAIAYGYSHSFFYQGWSQAHLRKMLDAGTPVIANVRVGLNTDGYGHSVLIIGLSPDGQRVMFHDPVQGMVEASWELFDRSWASFGPPYRHGTVVKP